jgi:hypothetical protein
MRGVRSSSAPSSRSYPEEIGDDFFPLPATLVFATLGLVGLDDILELFPVIFDFAAFGKGDSLSKRDG